VLSLILLPCLRAMGSQAQAAETEKLDAAPADSNRGGALLSRTLLCKKLPDAPHSDSATICS